MEMETRTEGQIMKKRRRSFKEHGKTPFGLWVAETLNEAAVTPQQFTSYSGYDQRCLQRILSGHSRLRNEDFIWIVECISDLTDRLNSSLYLEVLPLLTDVSFSKGKKK